MWTRLWHREVETQAELPGEIGVDREHGACLKFCGDLRITSDGSRESAYCAGDPYHRLLVYETAPEGFACVVEFHRPEQACTVNGELVQTRQELDDYFCIYAADHFHFAEDQGSESIEQLHRVIRQYDRQVLDVLRMLNDPSMTHCDKAGRAVQTPAGRPPNSSFMPKDCSGGADAGD